MSRIKDTKPDTVDLWLNEAELTGEEAESAREVLENLRDAPGALLSRVDPPAGYEQQLLAKLRMSLPLEAKAPAAAATVKARQGDRRSFGLRLLRSPAFSWSVSGVFALLALLTVQNFQSTGSVVSEAEMDLLAQAARKGGHEVVTAWVASMGDGAVQRRIAMADLDSAATALAGGEDRKSIDSILRDVARDMGMQ